MWWYYWPFDKSCWLVFYNLKFFDWIFFSFSAPNIFGHEEIKKGILCLLFGGSRKWDEQKHGEEIEEDETVGDRRIKVRSDINILLCGDPGTAKSQLLQYVYHLVPRAQFTSGKV